MIKTKKIIIGVIILYLIGSTLVDISTATNENSSDDVYFTFQSETEDRIYLVGSVVQNQFKIYLKKSKIIDEYLEYKPSKINRCNKKITILENIEPEKYKPLELGFRCENIKRNQTTCKYQFELSYKTRLYPQYSGGRDTKILYKNKITLRDIIDQIMVSDKSNKDARSSIKFISRCKDGKTTIIARELKATSPSDQKPTGSPPPPAQKGAVNLKFDGIPIEWKEIFVSLEFKNSGSKKSKLILFTCNSGQDCGGTISVYNFDNSDLLEVKILGRTYYYNASDIRIFRKTKRIELPSSSEPSVLALQQKNKHVKLMLKDFLTKRKLGSIYLRTDNRGLAFFHELAGGSLNNEIIPTIQIQGEPEKRIQPKKYYFDNELKIPANPDKSSEWKKWKKYAQWKIIDFLGHDLSNTLSNEKRSWPNTDKIISGDNFIGIPPYIVGMKIGNSFSFLNDGLIDFDKTFIFKQALTLKNACNRKPLKNSKGSLFLTGKKELKIPINTDKSGKCNLHYLKPQTGIFDKASISINGYKGHQNIVTLKKNDLLFFTPKNQSERQIAFKMAKSSEPIKSDNIAAFEHNKKRINYRISNNNIIFCYDKGKKDQNIFLKWQYHPAIEDGEILFPISKINSDGFAIDVKIRQPAIGIVISQNAGWTVKENVKEQLLDLSSILSDVKKSLKLDKLKIGLTRINSRLIVDLPDLSSEIRTWVGGTSFFKQDLKWMWNEISKENKNGILKKHLLVYIVPFFTKMSGTPFSFENTDIFILELYPDKNEQGMYENEKLLSKFSKYIPCKSVSQIQGYLVNLISEHL